LRVGLKRCFVKKKTARPSLDRFKLKKVKSDENSGLFTELFLPRELPSIEKRRLEVVNRGTQMRVICGAFFSSRDASLEEKGP
jgi:hypothetical protein